MKKILLSAILCFYFSAFGQTVVTSDTVNHSPAAQTYKKNEIGMGAGLVTGYGLSYRRWLAENDALMLNAAPYYRKNSDIEENSFDAGITFIHRVARYGISNLVIYSGFNIYSYNKTVEYTSYNNDFSTTFSIGGGPGIIFANNCFSFDFLTGFRYYSENTPNDHNRGLGFTIEVGGHFKY